MEDYFEKTQILAESLVGNVAFFNSQSSRLPQVSPLGWLGWDYYVIIYSYTETLNHAKYCDWLHFYLPPYTREKKAY